MSDQLPMFSRETSPGSASAISSPASESGPIPCDSPESQTIPNSGPAHALVSRSQRPVKRKALRIDDTFGQTGFDSSESEDQPSSSESKCRVLMDSDGFLQKVRTCKKCGIEKPYSEYYVNSKGNRRFTCRTCVAAKERKNKRKHAEKVSAAHASWRDRRRGYALVNVAKFRAKQKGIAFNLNPAQIQKTIDSGVCQLTGIRFNLDGGKTWDSPSLDRIDPSLGYTMDNVRVILYCVNVMANIWGPDKILEIASAISNQRKAQSDALSSALAEKLKPVTERLGSALFNLTWKTRVTPSGRTISALRASGRRTSEAGCSSWPTPRGEDSESSGMRHSRGVADTLTAVSGLTGWPTPQAHDVTTRGNTEADHHHLVHDLSNAAVLSAWPTPCVPNGGRVSSNREDMTKHADGTKAQIGLENVSRLAGWPTPVANDDNKTVEAHLAMKHRMGERDGTGANRTAVTSLQVMSQLAAWATPTVRDHKDGESEGTAPVNALLGRQAWLAGWKTPTAGCEGKGGAQDPQKRADGGHAVDLQDQVTLAGWPTPMAGSPATETYNEAGNTDSSRKTVALLDLRTASGGTQVGYYADQNGVVEIPLGGPLNASHSRWMMGLPPIWDLCALKALTPASRSRKNRKPASPDCEDMETE